MMPLLASGVTRTRAGKSRTAERAFARCSRPSLRRRRIRVSVQVAGVAQVS